LRKGLAVGLREIGRGPRVLYWLAVGLGVVLAAELVFGTTALRGLQGLLAQAYRGQGWPPLSALFRAVAEDAYKTSLNAYAERLNTVYGWIRLVGAGLVLLPALIFSVTIARRGGAEVRKLRSAAGSILSASIAVGIAAAIRVVGLFAGGLVALAVLLERGRKGVVMLAAYGLLALVVTYLSCPSCGARPCDSWRGRPRAWSSSPTRYCFAEARSPQGISLGTICQQCSRSS
jgi:hypothetical protein